MKLKFHTLDVFTAKPFTGNGLAVVLDADGLSDQRMQDIAREFNLSETIFVQRPADEAHTASVRIFMPGGELPFAGHPTVGCAVLLASFKYKAGCSFETDILLEEKAGLVPVKVSRLGSVARAVFTAPVLPKKTGKAPPNSRIAEALGLSEEQIGFGGHRPAVFAAGNPFLFVPVSTMEALALARVIEPYWSDMLGEARTFSAYIYTAGGARPDTAFRARLYAGGMAGASSRDMRWGGRARLRSRPRSAAGRLRRCVLAGKAVHVSEGTIEF